MDKENSGEIRTGTGLVHVYCGDGKGKTTAGMGLCLRAAGYGYRVLVCQFMKDNSSSELRALARMPGVMILPGPDNEKFSFQMTEEERKEKTRFYAKRLELAGAAAVREKADVLFLDEVLYAVRAGLLPEENLVRFLMSRPDGLEVILTGRDPGEEIIKLADYVSEIRKIKHPFDRSQPARDGIEK